MNFIFNEAKELVRLAGEEVAETTSTGSSVYTPFKQQMSTPDMLMNAGIVILVVFGVPLSRNFFLTGTKKSAISLSLSAWRNVCLVLWPIF